MQFLHWVEANRIIGRETFLLLINSNSLIELYVLKIDATTRHDDRCCNSIKCNQIPANYLIELVILASYIGCIAASKCGSLAGGGIFVETLLYRDFSTVVLIFRI